MFPILPALFFGVATAFLFSGCRRNSSETESIPHPSNHANASRVIKPPLSISLPDLSITPPSSTFRPTPLSLREFQGISLPPNLSAQVDLSGNLESGLAVFLRQVHVNSSDESISEQAKISQWELLRYLLEVLKPTTLFAEGLSENMTQAQVRTWVENHVSVEDQALLNRLRDNPFPIVPDDALRALVVKLRPALVYVYLARDTEIILHRVMTPEEARISERERQNLSACTHQSDATVRLTCLRQHENFVMQTREAWAVREISNYLRRNPGASIAIIFGAMHIFCDDFQRVGIRYRLLSVWAREASTEPRMQGDCY